MDLILSLYKRFVAEGYIIFKRQKAYQWFVDFYNTRTVNNSCSVSFYFFNGYCSIIITSIHHSAHATRYASRFITKPFFYLNNTVSIRVFRLTESSECHS